MNLPLPKAAPNPSIDRTATGKPVSAAHAKRQVSNKYLSGNVRTES
jgi:hypothetical protein